jgi:chemotaxis family two-component system response regulator Rcp1
VEDNRADVFLIRESIQIAGVDANLHVVPDGDKAIHFFELAESDPVSPCPVLVILDINLPKKQGREVLHHLRQSGRCGEAAVLVVTSSDSERDRDEMSQLGVCGYFRKPSEYEEFMKLGQLVKGLLKELASGSSQ